jgi:hypothetical protein
MVTAKFNDSTCANLLGNLFHQMDFLSIHCRDGASARCTLNEVDDVTGTFHRRLGCQLKRAGITFWAFGCVSHCDSLH